MRQLTEVVFILDRSGSMNGLEKDTIGGFNGMLENQKQIEGEVLISTVLFDDLCEVLHDRKPIAAIKPMTEREYYVRGCTALLDAIAEAKRFGIREEMATEYICDEVGTALNYEVVSEVVSCLRESRPYCANWKKKIEKDYASRSVR